MPSFWGSSSTKPRGRISRSFRKRSRARSPPASPAPTMMAREERSRWGCNPSRVRRPGNPEGSHEKEPQHHEYRQSGAGDENSRNQKTIHQTVQEGSQGIETGEPEILLQTCLGPENPVKPSQQQGTAHEKRKKPGGGKKVVHIIPAEEESQSKGVPAVHRQEKGEHIGPEYSEGISPHSEPTFQETTLKARHERGIPPDTGLHRSARDLRDPCRKEGPKRRNTPRP